MIFSAFIFSIIAGAIVYSSQQTDKTMKGLFTFAGAFIICFILGTYCPDDSTSTSVNDVEQTTHTPEEAFMWFESYLKDNVLKDPDSYEEISHTSDWNEYRQCYVVDVTYRAKNSFGGYVIERVMCDVSFTDDGMVHFKDLTQLQ